MRTHRVLAALVILALLLASCGRRGGTGSTVRLGPEDAGRAVELLTGDQLLLQLGPAAPEAGVGLSWRLVSYPEALLELESRSEADGRFKFAVVGEGNGQIRLSGSVPCDPTVERQPDAVGCPVGGEEPTDARGGTFPVKLFSVTVSVS